MGYTVEPDTPGDTWGVTEPSARPGEPGALLAGRSGPPKPDFVPSARETGELVRRIVRCEARFRGDGLLPPEGRVRGTVAYDHGRAVNVARWGLPARFCTPHEAEQAVVHAGGPSRAAHGSWEDFSAVTRWAGCCGPTRRSTAPGTRTTSSATASSPNTRAAPLEAHPLALGRP
ncbi:DUF1266 domain-containing protein [Streptomyces cinereoruber]|uniref:DUF1266 domain-containing protein n=1 Tax=Streptomyces cinereoruber TaxID=67260 RepID=UPI003BF5B3A0